MAHLASQVKGGYYPFPVDHLPALASLFKGGGGGLILDPVAGEGDALEALARAWKLTPYANELDQIRAAACAAKFGPTQAVQGDLMTLRTPNRSFSIVFVNPPYAENTGRAEEKRREFEHLAHAWKWAADGGFVLWVVYAHHMTERAASFLVKHSSQVDIYRIPGLHLDSYPQIVVVAKVRPAERSGSFDAEALRLVEACRQPDALPLLEVLPEPRYRIPPAPPVKRFYFHPEQVSAELMLPALLAGGAQRAHAFRAVLETPPPEPPLSPVVPPRGGQLGLILAAGLFNGLVLDLEDGPAAVRGVARMVEVDTTPPELRGQRETFETRAQVTVTLLGRDGRVTRIAGGERDRLLRFLQTHQDAFLKHLSAHSQPLYDFDHSHYAPVFERVFRNRPLPGRPVTGLFETQKHVVGAIMATLYKRRKVILSADMGTGKTPMAASAIAALWHDGRFKPGQIAVVMAPPHLIQKWESELRDVIPGCVPHIADKATGQHGTLVDDVAAFMRRVESKPEKLHVLILSRERAKLGEGWTPAFQIRHRRFAQWPKGGAIPRHFLDSEGKPLPGIERVVTQDIPICPTCATPISSSKSGEGKTEPLKWLKTKPRACHHCGAALWQYSRSFSAPAPGQTFPKRNPRYPVARFLRERYPHRVAVAVCDELHEAKSMASDQGRAMQDLVHIADYSIGLTGTLFGGMASSVFWLEWAFNPGRMPINYPLDEGVEVALNRWVRSMGVMVRVVEYRQDAQAGATNGTDRHEHRPEEAPGLSPLLIRELLDHTLWLGLPDLAFALPEYREIPVPVKLPADIQSHYERESAKLKDYLIGCKREGDASFLGSYLQAVLRYPSTCYQARPVTHRSPHKDPQGRQITHLVGTLQGFGEGRIYPKEQALLDLLRDELAAGRPCAVFIAQSGQMKIQERLAKLIREHVPGSQPLILESDTVATEKRDGWLKEQVKKGANVLICNPRLIETGLDLLFFKSLIFYEVAYSLYTVAQASRRHWRVGQSAECRVYHLYYSGTMEEQAIALVSEKQAAAALLGGDADGGGLAQLSGGALSLEAELAKAIAADTRIVDVSQLFRQSARASADFASGWAQGVVDESALQVVPLDNLVGRRFYHAQQAHEVTDYGPLTEASYRVKNLVTGDLSLLPADLVKQAKAIDESAPLTQPAPARRAAPADAPLPQVPLLEPVHRARAQHPTALILVERAGFFYAYGPDAVRAAEALGLKPALDARLIEGQKVAQLGLPAAHLDASLKALKAKGLAVAIMRLKQAAAPQVEATPEPVAPKAEAKSADPKPAPVAPKADPLPLADVYRRWREHQRPGALTFVEAGEGYLCFDEQAITVAERLRQSVDSRPLKGGPTVQLIRVAKGPHELAFARLRKSSELLLIDATGALTTLPAEAPKARPALPPKLGAAHLQQVAHGQLALL